MALRKKTPGAGGAAKRSPQRAPTVLKPADIALWIELRNAPEVGRALAQTLRGWDLGAGRGPAAPADVGLSHVRRTKRGYAIRSHYLKEDVTGLGIASVTCAVIADLAEDYYETRPGCIALHCAAFQFRGKLIALTGPRRAGKSTLAARLTAEPDIQLFCDDVLPLLPDGQAVGLGIAPRLRLPLPETASPEFARHAEQHMGPRDDRYGYLCAPTIAPHGSRAPLSVLVLLDRRPEAEATLHAMQDDEALRWLLSQNMSDLETADAAFGRLTELLTDLTCLRMVYSDLESAVALLRRAFDSTAPVSPAVEIRAPLPDPLNDPLPAADISPDLCWSRTADAHLQIRGEGAFLWQAGRRTIWQLNRLGLAVWTLLEVPGSAREIGHLLSETFPDQDREALVGDVNALLQALAGNGLLEQLPDNAKG